MVFAFTGQGAQWTGMGTNLMSHFDTFRRDIRTLDQILQEIESPPSWSIEGTNSHHITLGVLIVFGTNEISLR